VLEGARVRLEPLTEAHLPGLAAAIRDGRLWEIAVTFVPQPDDLASFLSAAEAAFAAGRELAFATLDAKSGRVLGSTRFRCIEPEHRRVEIGFTFLAASAQRTHVNTEAKYLMLSHAFEAWGCNRVELLTDERNSKSRDAIMRIGAREEGVLRNHMIMRDGFVRSSVLYSLIASEWPQAKLALEARLRAA
jgi:RimJ/RimL family protein N-acetyltransferase